MAMRGALLASGVALAAVLDWPLPGNSRACGGPPPHPIAAAAVEVRRLLSQGLWPEAMGTLLPVLEQIVKEHAPILSKREQQISAVRVQTRPREDAASKLGGLFTLYEAFQPTPMTVAGVGRLFVACAATATERAAMESLHRGPFSIAAFSRVVHALSPRRARSKRATVAQSSTTASRTTSLRIRLLWSAGSTLFGFGGGMGWPSVWGGGDDDGGGG